MKKASGLDYVFAIGKVRALEKFLITEEVFAQALEADLREALRLFAENELYSDEFSGVKNSQELEFLLNQEFSKLQKEVRELILDEDLADLLDIEGAKCVGGILKKYSSGFLSDYLKHIIDMHNIKTFLRLRRLKEPIEKLQGHLICEGFIPKSLFLSLYGQDLSAFLNRLEYVHKHQEIVSYAEYLADAIGEIEKNNSFIALEKSSDDFLMKILKEAKHINFGPEPVLAYYFARVNEINLIRLIILSKMNNLEPEKTAKRLNLVYA